MIHITSKGSPEGHMLSQEQNELLTRVSRGTPAGELLRRYWHPVAATSQLETTPTRRVRLLGEDLVLYKNRKGEFGLIQESCPHRSASLAYGIPEEQGLRCQYHGWLFDDKGACLEMPNEPEDTTFHKRIRAQAYPVQELGGLLFAYLGPEPAPLLPRWDVLTWTEGVVKQIGFAVLPCNWLQIMENSADPVHGEWLHGKFFEHQLEQANLDSAPAKRYSRHHVKIGFSLFDYGIIKRRVLEGASEEDEDWKVGHPLVFPNFLRVGGNFRHEHQYRVPIDDENTLHIWYQVLKPEGIEVPKQDTIPWFEMPYRDENGEFVLDTINGQDIMAWVTQGHITDRSVEHLGTTDRGVIMLRQLLKQQIEAVEKGEDPLGTVRDPNANEMLTLPMEHHKLQAGVTQDMWRPLGMARELNAPEVQETIDRMVAQSSAR